MVTTGDPPKSSRKAAHGTRAIAMRALCAKEDGENRDFFKDLLLLTAPLKLSLLLGLGFE